MTRLRLAEEIAAHNTDAPVTSGSPSSTKRVLPSALLAAASSNAVRTSVVVSASLRGSAEGARALPHAVTLIAGHRDSGGASKPKPTLPAKDARIVAQMDTERADADTARPRLPAASSAPSMSTAVRAASLAVPSTSSSSTSNGTGSAMSEPRRGAVGSGIDYARRRRIWQSQYVAAPLALVRARVRVVRAHARAERRLVINQSDAAAR
jgi:hypothetical protein